MWTDDGETPSDGKEDRGRRGGRGRSRGEGEEPGSVIKASVEQPRSPREEERNTERTFAERGEQQDESEKGKKRRKEEEPQLRHMTSSSRARSRCTMGAR